MMAARLHTMSASEVTSQASLPITVTIAAPEGALAGTGLPAAFRPGSEWQIYVFPFQPFARITVFEVQGTWILCSVINNPIEKIWIHPTSFPNVSFSEVVK